MQHIHNGWKSIMNYGFNMMYFKPAYIGNTFLFLWLQLFLSFTGHIKPMGFFQHYLAPAYINMISFADLLL